MSAAEIKVTQDRHHFADGLRGLFSVVVLLFHVFFVFFDRGMPPYRSFGMVFDGTTAVHIFFVLSGFSLSIAYLTALQSNNSKADDIIRRMAAARYVRLAIPCLAACLIMYAVMALGQNYFAKIPDDAKIQWWAWAYREQSVSIAQTLKFSLYDIFLPLLFVPVVPYNGTYLITNLWTMPIEFMGSFIVFIYCFVVRSNSHRLVATIALMLITSLAQSHLAFFFAGIIVSEIFLRFKDRPRILWREVAIALTVAGLFVFWSPQRFQIDVIICMTFVLLCALGYWTRAFFGSAPFRYLGKISFALYLVHMPIIVSIESYLFLTYRNVMSPGWLVALAGGTSIAVSLVAAHFFSYVDRFAIRLSHAVGRMLTAPDARVSVRPAQDNATVATGGTDASRAASKRTTTAAAAAGAASASSSRTIASS